MSNSTYIQHEKKQIDDLFVLIHADKKFEIIDSIIRSIKYDRIRPTILEYYKGKIEPCKDLIKEYKLFHEQYSKRMKDAAGTT